LSTGFAANQRNAVTAETKRRISGGGGCGGCIAGCRSTIAEHLPEEHEINTSPTADCGRAVRSLVSATDSMCVVCRLPAVIGVGFVRRRFC